LIETQRAQRPSQSIATETWQKNPVSAQTNVAATSRPEGNNGKLEACRYNNARLLVGAGFQPALERRSGAKTFVMSLCLPGCGVAM